MQEAFAQSSKKSGGGREESIIKSLSLNIKIVKPLMSMLHNLFIILSIIVIGWPQFS